MKNKKMLETAVRDLMGNNVVSVSDYQRILTKIFAECLDRGYLIRVRPGERMDGDVTLESSKADEIRGRITVSTKCRRLTAADGFPNGSMCHLVNLSVTRPCGHVIAERRLYWKADDSASVSPFHGTGAMWDTANEALSAVEKALRRRRNAPNVGLGVDANVVKRFYGADALRLHTSGGNDILSLLKKDGRKNVRAEDILAVDVRHTRAEGFIEAAYTVNTRNGDSRTWSFSYDEGDLRRERRDCRSGMVLVHGEHIPPSLCGKGQPRVYAEAVVGIRKNADVRDYSGSVLGYFLLTTHPVYGFTYAITDTRGALLKNGYVPSKEPENVKDTFVQIAERYGLFRGFDELQFALKPIVSYAPLKFPLEGTVPLNVMAAATYAPFEKNYHMFPRDLADISPEEWDAERHFVRDGDTVNICGWNDACGYRLNIEKAVDGMLVLRSAEGTTVNVFADGAIVRAYCGMNGSSTPIALTPENKDELRIIMHSLEKEAK